MLARLFASKQPPDFKRSRRWDTLSLDLSGCHFEITLPPQDFDFPEDPINPKIDVFDEAFYNDNTEPDRNGYPPNGQGVSNSGLFRRNWFSYGPIWQTSHIGILQCSSVICDTSRMTSKLNCFNPEHLERLIVHGLYYSDGPGFGLNEHTTPVNWQVRSLEGNDWVYLESWDRAAAWEAHPSPYDDAHFSVWLTTPLFADKYLLVSFSALGSLPADASNRAMFECIETIIASMKLRLSPKALRQKREAERAYPDAHYSPHREPEPWRYYGSFRYGEAGESRVAFEGTCSPPPPLSFDFTQTKRTWP
ncbi:MAG: hypothetical protein WDA11_09720 [Thiohalomonadaceae bacterium]